MNVGGLTDEFTIFGEQLLCASESVLFSFALARAIKFYNFSSSNHQRNEQYLYKCFESRMFELKSAVKHQCTLSNINSLNAHSQRFDNSLCIIESVCDKAKFVVVNLMSIFKKYLLKCRP